MNNPNAKAAVLASLIGDSLALGPHWIYDVRKLNKTFGRATDPVAPPDGSYHDGKAAGDQTHYGDQVLVLLESVAALGRFDQEDWSQRWRDLFSDYGDYIDKATSITLSNYAAGEGVETAGSSSEDLSGAARSAPLLPFLAADPAGLVAAARAQTGLTHNNPLVLDGAEFLTRTALAALNGSDPVSALKEAAGFEYRELPIGQWLDKGLASVETKTVRAVFDFGQDCNIHGAMPSVIHLIAKYPTDLETALIESTMAGGDSAGRNLAVGMILGAGLGLEAIPQRWLDSVNCVDRVEELLG